MATSSTTATTKAAPLLEDPPIGDQVRHLSEQSVHWVSHHGLSILIGCAIAAVIVMVMIGIKMVGIKLCRSDDTGTHWRTTIGRALAKTRIWFMAAIAAQLVAGYAHAPDSVAKTIQFFFTIGVTLQVAVWVRELILGAVAYRAGADESHALGSALGIVRLLVTVAVFAIATVLILDNLGVNVTGLVAGLGIGGIAIGLAAQGIFSDLFAALSILFDKPFRRGDGIKFDQTSGSVEAIGLKTTRVRSATGEEVVISNANLLNKELRNYSRLEHRRMIHKLGLIYQTQPDVLRGISDRIRKIVERHKYTQFLRCGIAGLGASSIDFELQFDIHSTDYEVVFATNHEILIEIVSEFAEAGIEFAYPTQTTFTAAPDGRIIMPYPDASHADADHCGDRPSGSTPRAPEATAKDA
ncbi:mechanosensitive ion channel family protein [Flavisphingomonas formosensis]|uniref:mechanosensitive ion channel family protein n=1 Tax=Flavisphingomonas formosensis TaxID=861534 RepID=UPI0012FCB1F9|nr:mechanosensitive ion channel domain-containing protein [Sphingomonas formosensis]